MMKNKLNVFDLAYYYEIICRLLCEFNVVSEIKLIFLSYSVKNLSEDFKGTRQKYNTYEIILNGARRNILRNINDFCYIFECINLLKKQKNIESNNGLISIKKAPEYSKTIKCLDLSLLKQAIGESEKLSDESLLRGILDYV